MAAVWREEAMSWTQQAEMLAHDDARRCASKHLVFSCPCELYFPWLGIWFLTWHDLVLRNRVLAFLPSIPCISIPAANASLISYNITALGRRQCQLVFSAFRVRRRFVSFLSLTGLVTQVPIRLQSELRLYSSLGLVATVLDRLEMSSLLL